MAQVIRYIDEIAREKQAPVLFLEFGLKLGDNYENCKARNDAISWLDANGVKYEKAGPFVTNAVVFGYAGHLYLDVPFDEKNDVYQLVDNHFMNGNKPRYDGVCLYYLPLEEAMKNVERDEPSFWDDF